MIASLRRGLPVAIALLLSACGADDAPSSPPPDAGSPDTQSAADTIAADVVEETDASADVEADAEADVVDTAEVIVCGDGVVSGDEVCDDGNTKNGDYCSADCRLVTGKCGDGTRQESEACDDGNTTSGDYCSADCTAITGKCGDSIVQTNETCDDGNTAPFDHCSPDCATVTGRCGDSIVQSNEGCDFGKAEDDGKGCSATCKRVGTCGDGILQSDFEECDDGNTNEADFCTTACKAIPRAYGSDVALTTDTVIPGGARVELGFVRWNVTGATLTIEQGARFTSVGGGRIVVGAGGKLVMKGTSAQPVVFTSSATSPHCGDFGGIVVNAGGSADIAFATIRYAQFGVDAAGAATIRDTTMQDLCEHLSAVDTATGPSFGIRSSSADLTVARTTIQRVIGTVAASPYPAGASYGIHLVGSGTRTLDSVTVADITGGNKSMTFGVPKEGVGIVIDDATVRPTFDRVTVLRVRAAGARAAGLAVKNGSASFTNVVVGDVTGSSASALVSLVSTDVSLTHATLFGADNTATAAAIDVSGTSKLSLAYAIVTAIMNPGIGIRLGTGSTATLLRNLVFGFATGYSGVAAGTTDLAVDPTLTSPSTYDYTLKSGSPAIDAATGSTTTIDRNGKTRDSKPDLGAFEF